MDAGAPLTLFRRSFAFLALSFAAGEALACIPPETSAIHALHEHFPEALTPATDGRELSFCPDNTCIEMRSSVANPELEAWMLAYLFHFGDYHALEAWRADVAPPAGRLDYPAALEACLGQSNPTACMRDAFADARIEVREVRYDEGARSEMPSRFHETDPGSARGVRPDEDGRHADP